MFFATFEVCNKHIFYYVFQREHRGELKSEKNFVDITKIFNRVLCLCKIWGPPLRKIPKFEPLFCSSKFSYVTYVMFQVTKARIKKKIGIKNYPSSVIALKLVLLRHNLLRHPYFLLLILS